MKLKTIGFDADDTLWHNERFFQLTQQRFAELLADFTENDQLMTRLLAAERRNLTVYGYGVKGFVLSMIETALEVTDDKVPTDVIRQLLSAGKDMLNHPIDLMPYAAEIIEALANDYEVVIITKGDLVDQERKIAQSGLGDMVHGVEILAEKTTAAYQQVFQSRGVAPRATLMVGNSVKSDIIPAIAAGGHAAWVPHELTWELEIATEPDHSDRYFKVQHLGELPSVIAQIEG